MERRLPSAAVLQQLSDGCKAHGWHFRCGAFEGFDAEIWVELNHPDHPTRFGTLRPDSGRMTIAAQMGGPIRCLQADLHETTRSERLDELVTAMLEDDA